MVAITLVAGAAAFGWVNGQAASSESAYGQSAAAGANYLREHFAYVTSTFTGPGGADCPSAGCTIANIWVFNNGQLAFTLSSLSIMGGNSTFPLNIHFTPTNFTAYNAAGAALPCVPNTPGFSVPNPNPVPQSTLSQPPYSVTIPTSCPGVNAIKVGLGYAITMVGKYGNVVLFQVTANG
jgi:hypothetical protein